MIFYFSGTGNSAYAAGKLAEQLGEKPVSINQLIKTHRKGVAEAGEVLIFVTPVYGWRMPRLVENWIRKSNFPGKHEAYFVMTCGDSTGDAAVYAQKLCRECGFVYKGCRGIVMPENYIALFKAPDQEEAKKIIAEADPVIREVGEVIKEDRFLQREPGKLWKSILSGPVNDIFYKKIIRADHFRAADACVGCGVCETVCPLNNIQLKDGRPVWGNHCTHCMACICRCPQEAVEYGRRSRGKNRYTCPGQIV